MQSFENRTLQLETTPKARISENSVKPQKDEGKSRKELPTAWTHVPRQLNPGRDKIFNFATKISDQNLVPILLLRLVFFSERQQIKSYFPWLDLMFSARSTLTVTKSLNFQDPKTSRELLGRPHLLRMDSSLDTWQICKLPRHLLLSHTQMKLRIKRI